MDTDSAQRQDQLAGMARDAASGDERALQALLLGVSPAMVGAIRTMVATADIDDVIQDALVGLVRALPSFRFECSVKHFACRIAVQTATVARRGRLRREAAYDRMLLGPAPEQPGSPADDVVSQRRRAALCMLLDELPEEQAEAMALRTVLECSLEEVAETAGAPINTIRSRMRLARKALRTRIESDPAFASLAEGYATGQRGSFDDDDEASGT